MSDDLREEAHERRMAQENRRNWDAFIEQFPITGVIRMNMARCSQIMAKEHESSPIYHEAQGDYRALELMLGENGRFAADR